MNTFLETTKHKLWVTWYIIQVCITLLKRAVIHDLSKYSRYEAPYFKQADLLKKLADVDYGSTGGTSGTPLHFYLDASRSSVEYAYLTISWERVGYELGMPMAVLRGRTVRADRAGLRPHAEVSGLQGRGVPPLRRRPPSDRHGARVGRAHSAGTGRGGPDPGERRRVALREERPRQRAGGSLHDYPGPHGRREGDAGQRAAAAGALDPGRCARW